MAIASIEPIELLENDDDICEICYNSKKDIDLSCKTCSKSTCIKCCNLNKSRKYDYKAKDIYDTEYANEMTIQYECPYCRCCNSKSICDFKNIKVILSAFDKNCTDVSLTNIVVSKNIDNISKDLYELINTKQSEYERIILQYGTEFARSKTLEFEEDIYSDVGNGYEVYKDLTQSFNKMTIPQRMTVCEKYNLSIYELKNERKERIVVDKECVKLLIKLNECEGRIATYNLFEKNKEDTALAKANKEIIELKKKYNDVANKYNNLTNQFVAMSKGSNDIIENICGAINNVKKSSKKQTINIIKKYLNNVVSVNTNIPSIDNPIKI